MKKVHIILICIFGFHPLFSSVVDKGLRFVPEIDKKKIDCFFEYAIKLENAGHTLYFKSKPVCLIGFWLDGATDQKFREGWETFCKYEELFPSKSFILNSTLVNLSDKKAIHIYLVNKESLISCIDQHSIIFKEILNKEVNGLNFLYDIENGNQFMDLIEHNEVLLGILLGYGEESSKLYNKNKLLSIKNKSSKNSYYTTITSEIKENNEIFPVAFKGSKYSKEASKINAQFQQDRQDLWKVFLEKNKDPTKFFLEAYCN